MDQLGVGGTITLRTDIVVAALATLLCLLIAGSFVRDARRRRGEEERKEEEVLRRAHMREKRPSHRDPTKTPLQQAVALLREMAIEKDEDSEQINQAVQILVSRAAVRSSTDRFADSRAMTKGVAQKDALGVLQWMPVVNESSSPIKPAKYDVEREVALSERVVHPAIMERCIERPRQCELTAMLEHGVRDWEFDSLR